MENTTLLSSLNLMTLGIFLLVLIGAFLWHLRSRKNREATARVFDMDKPKS